MLSYRLKCREKSESKNPEVWKKKKPQKNRRRMLLWKCSVCNSKKLKNKKLKDY